MANITLLGASYTDVPAVTLPQTGGGLVTFYENGGEPLQMGVIRPDAELVERWTDDFMAVEDAGLTIPAYTTTATVLKASTNIATYDGTPLTYRYFITERTLTTPTYSIDTKGKGREDYVYCTAGYEWIYNPSGEIKSWDKSKSYGQYSQMMGYSACARYVYWSSSTAITPYTSTAYGFYQTITAPTLASHKTITIKSPAIGVRGHSTYLTSTYMNALTDARCQYVIELWRVPLEEDTLEGWVHKSQMAHIIDDLNNGGTLT